MPAQQRGHDREQHDLHGFDHEHARGLGGEQPPSTEWSRSEQGEYAVATLETCGDRQSGERRRHDGQGKHPWGDCIDGWVVTDQVDRQAREPDQQDEWDDEGE